MARLDVCTYRDYSGLLPHEVQAIQEYISGNPKELTDLIKSGNFISEGMRIAIVDLLEGQLKRHRSNTANRNFKIYEFITGLIERGECKSVAKAAEILYEMGVEDRVQLFGSRECLSISRYKNIHSGIKKSIEESEQELREELYLMYKNFES